MLRVSINRIPLSFFDNLAYRVPCFYRSKNIETHMPQTVIEVALDQLHFDPENPRLPQRLKHAPESEVLEYLLLECNLIELMLSIGEQGYFQGEPLLVVARATGDGYEVVEGNRRLGAMKLLQPIEPPVMPKQIELARASAKHFPTLVPVLAFASRDDILSYLGYKHITGIKEWNAIAKARYLRQLRLRYNTDNLEAHKALAREIGSKSTYVAKLLTGLALIERARDIGLLMRLKVEEDDLPFSLLTTAIGYEHICRFIGLNGSSDVDAVNIREPEFNELFTWVFDKSHGATKLGDSRNLDKLARIVSHEKALVELRRGATLEQADLFTSGPLDAVRSLMLEAENRIASAQSTLSIADGITESDVAQADRLRKACIALHSSIHSLLEPSE